MSQELGDDENAVVSQKVITENISELSRRIDYWNPTVSISPAATYTIEIALQKLQEAGVNVSTGFRLGFTNSEYKYEEWRATAANIFEIDNWVKQAIIAESEFANINNNISVLKGTKANLWNPTKQVSPAKTYTINTALQAAQDEEITFSSGDKIGFTNAEYEYEEWLCTQNNSYNISDWEKVCVRYSDIDKKANLWNATKQISPNITYTIETALIAANDNGIVFNSGDKIGFTNHDYIYEEWLCKQNGSYNISDWEKVCVRYSDLEKFANKKLYGYIHYNVTNLHPESGIDGGNKYTLNLAAPLVPQEFRNTYTRVIFMNSSYELEEWQCLNNADWTNTSSKNWVNIGVVQLRDLIEKFYSHTGICNVSTPLSDDASINDVIKELYIPNVQASDIDRIIVYKAFNDGNDDNYGFVIHTISDGKNHYYIKKNNPSTTNSIIFNAEGAYAVINWNAIVDGGRIYSKNQIKVSPTIEDRRNSPIIYNYLNFNAEEEVDIVIGDKIYAVVGDRLQLFHKGIFNCANLNNYIIRIECSKGKSYPRYFEYIPTSSDVGEVDITFNIYKPSSLMDYTGVLLASKKSKLLTVNTKSSPSTLKRILMIGDSTITAGVFQNEAYRRLAANDGTPVGMGLSNIKMLGRKTSNKYGVTVGYEGTSGWSWNNYIAPESKTIKFNVTGVTNVDIDAIYTVQSGDITLRMLVMETNIVEGTGYIRCAYNSDSPSYSAIPDPSGTMKRVSGSGDSSITYTSIEEDNYSPFWNVDTSSIDIKSYVDTYCEGNIDYFVCVLGINSISQMFSYNKTVDTIMQEVKTLIDAVHEEFPSVKIMIATIPMPSQNGGAGASFNASYRAVKEDYERRAKNINAEYINFALKDEYSSFVSIINLSAEFDCDYLYPTTEVSANPRTTEKEVIGTSSSHPSTNGYLSEGDCIFRYLYGII